MTKKNMIILAVAIFCVAAISWKQKNSAAPAKDSSEMKQASNAYLFPWDYVMDWRYGRTCGPGGGICFKNGFGDIFEYWNGVPASFNGVAVADVPGDKGDDKEVGPMYLHVEDAKLHVIFCRSVEGSSFDIDEPVRFREALLQALGKQFTLRPGRYNVDYNRYKDFGEAWIDIQ